MFRTLETFQSEWFSMKFTTETTNEVGIINDPECKLVPNVYAKNEMLSDKVINLTRQTEKLKTDLNNLKDDYEKLAKERDFHRMHHRRITQEKDKLLNDIKRQTMHYKNYEPSLKELRRKYESAMKEKMLSNLERDRAVAHLNALLENQKFKAENVGEDGQGEKGVHDSNLGTGFREDRETGKIGPTQHNLQMARQDVEQRDAEKKAAMYENESDNSHPKVSSKNFVGIY